MLNQPFCSPTTYQVENGHNEFSVYETDFRPFFVCYIPNDFYITHETTYTYERFSLLLFVRMLSARKLNHFPCARKLYATRAKRRERTPCMCGSRFSRFEHFHMRFLFDVQEFSTKKILLQVTQISFTKFEIF